jgi:DNA-directed RNA polymerase specialized sigma24 family protein
VALGAVLPPDDVRSREKIPTRVVQEGRWGVYRGMPVDDFAVFIERVRPRLARAFVAAYGPQRGEEALAEAMAVAWAEFDDIVWMENPAGFLYRVGQTRSKPRRRLQPMRLPRPGNLGLPDIDPALPRALDQLTERQRVCVALVHGFGWTHQEVADLLEVARTSVQNHVERGLQRIRSEMGVTPRA